MYRWTWSEDRAGKEGLASIGSILPFLSTDASSPRVSLQPPKEKHRSLLPEDMLRSQSGHKLLHWSGNRWYLGCYLVSLVISHLPKYVFARSAHIKVACLLKLNKIPGSSGAGRSHLADGPPVPAAGRKHGGPIKPGLPAHPTPRQVGHPAGSVSLPNTPPSRPHAAPSYPSLGGRQRHTLICFYPVL